jgi:hypothetical protein
MSSPTCLRLVTLVPPPNAVRGRRCAARRRGLDAEALRQPGLDLVGDLRVFSVYRPHTTDPRANPAGRIRRAQPPRAAARRVPRSSAVVSDSVSEAWGRLRRPDPRATPRGGTGARPGQTGPPVDERRRRRSAIPPGASDLRGTLALSLSAIRAHARVNGHLGCYSPSPSSSSRPRSRPGSEPWRGGA